MDLSQICASLNFNMCRMPKMEHEPESVLCWFVLLLRDVREQCHVGMT